MAKVIVLGAGISGHTSAQILKRKLGRNHEIIVISPNTPRCHTNPFKWQDNKSGGICSSAKPSLLKAECSSYLTKTG